jgi:hypothetical protein
MVAGRLSRGITSSDVVGICETQAEVLELSRERTRRAGLNGPDQIRRTV